MRVKPIDDALWRRRLFTNEWQRGVCWIIDDPRNEFAGSHGPADLSVWNNSPRDAVTVEEAIRFLFPS